MVRSEVKGSAFENKALYPFQLDFPGHSVVKNLPANAGHVGSIPESGRFPGEGHGNPP